MTPELQNLLADWTEIPKRDFTRRFCATMEAPRCCCNNHLEGIQVNCDVCEMVDGSAERIHLEIVAEKPDGEWINIGIYTLRDTPESLAKFNDQVRQLIVAWTAIYESCADKAK